MQKRDLNQFVESRADRIMYLEDRLWILSANLPNDHVMIQRIEEQIDALKRDDRDLIPLF